MASLQLNRSEKMRTFAQKQNQPQNLAPSSLARSNTAAPGLHHRADLIPHLQRTIGNQAVLRMLHNFGRVPIHPPSPAAIQTKLAISEPGDKYEQEADRISERVMRMPEQQQQVACDCGGECPKCQTEQLAGEQKHLQTNRVASGGLGQTEVPPIVHEVLGSPGQLLDAATRAFLEPKFGFDFSRVRIHTDTTAAYSARAVNALAYTVGQDIVFGKGQFQPGTSHGQRLLTHELAHVVQQNQSGFPAKLRETGGGIAGSLRRRVPAGALIQRSAKFVTGPEPDDQNIAEQVIAQKTVAADALPVLNGTAFLNNTQAESFAVIAKKINASIAQPAPKFSALPGKEGVECWLEGVGSNEGSYDMHLPAKPPWSQDTTVDKLRAAFKHYGVSVPPECRTADGDTNLTVEGDPDSATLAKGIGAHERHHADDYKAAFNDTIVPWDQKLTALLADQKKAAEKFRGKDRQGCVDKIVERVGGSLPVAEKFLKEIVDKAKDFHKSNPLLQLDRPRAGPSCAKSWVKAKL